LLGDIFYRTLEIAPATPAKEKVYLSFLRQEIILATSVMVVSSTRRHCLLIHGLTMKRQ